MHLKSIQKLIENFWYVPGDVLLRSIEAIVWKEYKFKQFTQNDTSHTLYIQELTDDDILYLADQIKNMVVRAHPIDEDIYI